MADSISSSQELNIGIEYTYDVSKDPRLTYLKIPNPEDNLTENGIKTAVTTFLTNAVIIDASGSPISSDNITTAYTTDQTITAVDIGVTD